MGLVVITAPTAEPITLAQACAQCRIDVGDDDAQITLAIAGARAMCEGLLKRPIITRTYEQTLDLFPCAEIRLAVASVQSMVSVKYTDVAGIEQTLGAQAYLLDITDETSQWLFPALGTSWPPTQATINAVRLRFVAGMAATADGVPADVRAWLLLTVAYLYKQREAMDLTGKAMAIPSRFTDALLDPWRTYP